MIHVAIYVCGIYFIIVKIVFCWLELLYSQVSTFPNYDTSWTLQHMHDIMPFRFLTKISPSGARKILVITITTAPLFLSNVLSRKYHCFPQNTDHIFHALVVSCPFDRWWLVLLVTFGVWGPLVSMPFLIGGHSPCHDMVDYHDMSSRGNKTRWWICISAIL